MAQGTIEVAPLAFMRGRTLNDAFVILDEAQNTTVEQMKMFLTRLGFDSKAVVTGRRDAGRPPHRKALRPHPRAAHPRGRGGHRLLRLHRGRRGAASPGAGGHRAYDRADVEAARAAEQRQPSLRQPPGCRSRRHRKCPTSSAEVRMARSRCGLRCPGHWL